MEFYDHEGDNEKRINVKPIQPILKLDLLEDSKGKVIEYGFFYASEGILFANRKYDQRGFEKNEIGKIASQLKKYSEKCLLRTCYQDVLVKSNDLEFYVTIDDLGDVYLPELKKGTQERITGKYMGKNHGMTDKSNEIVDFIKIPVKNKMKKKISRK